MNKEQEKILIYYISIMLRVWGNDMASNMFISDYKNAGSDIND